jgi:hypothetical protein
MPLAIQTCEKRCRDSCSSIAALPSSDTSRANFPAMPAAPCVALPGCMQLCIFQDELQSLCDLQIIQSEANKLIAVLLWVARDDAADALQVLATTVITQHDTDNSQR